MVEGLSRTPTSGRRLLVKDTLVAQGIGATQITSDGYGPEQPIASNDTEEGRSRNRRVELVAS
jgi:OmpA-OmpF porin, OOP family